MTRQISEPDWRLFRQVHAAALDRFCTRVLAEIGQLVAATDRASHERYRAVVELVERRDRELAAGFDDLRRSTAWRQLVFLRSRGLVTDDEWAGFSLETRGAVGVWLGADQVEPIAAAHRPEAASS